jgi:hypothetical protein
MKNKGGWVAQTLLLALLALRNEGRNEGSLEGLWQRSHAKTDLWPFAQPIPR